jgi:hypothetical protein
VRAWRRHRALRARPRRAIAVAIAHVARRIRGELRRACRTAWLPARILLNEREFAAVALHPRALLP